MGHWYLWWVWIVAGFALAVLEVIIPGYIFLGFAAGAVLVGIGLGFGIIGGPVPLLLLIFAVLSLWAWFTLRKLMGVRNGQVKIWDRDINDN